MKHGTLGTSEVSFTEFVQGMEKRSRCSPLIWIWCPTSKWLKASWSYVAAMPCYVHVHRFAFRPLFCRPCSYSRSTWNWGRGAAEDVSWKIFAKSLPPLPGSATANASQATICQVCEGAAFGLNNGSNIIKPWALAHGFMILEPLFKQFTTITLLMTSLTSPVKS